MMLTVGLLTNLGADEAVLRCCNEKGLCVAENEAFERLFPGETIGTTRTYVARGTEVEVTTLRTGVDPNLIWKSKADR